MSSRGMHQIIHEPTRFNSIRTCNTLDLLFSNDPYSLGAVDLLDPFSTSDHLTISFSIFFPDMKSIHVLSLIRRFDSIPSYFRFTTGRLPILMLLTPYWGHLIGTNYSDIISGPTPCGQNLKVLSGHLSTNFFQKS